MHACKTIAPSVHTKPQSITKYYTERDWIL